MYQAVQQRPWQTAGQAMSQPTPSYGYPAPAAPPSAPQPEMPKQEEWLSDSATAARKYAEYLQATQFAPALRAQAIGTAQTNRELVKLQRQDEFRRWGPEIEMTLQQMAPDPVNWTPMNITAVVDMVKARHVNELIAEERAKYTNELGGTALRPSTGGAPGATSAMASNTVDLEKLPPGYRDALKTLAVDQRTIDEFLYRTYVKGGMEPDLDKARERWVKQVQRGDVFSDNRTLESQVY